jgi:hypothetical protein
MLNRLCFRLRFALALILTATASGGAIAQTPGEWRYTIATEQSNIPADMRVNFPTITFSSCRSAEDFASGRAFALQTLASSAARCPSAGFARAPLASSKGESLRFVYACDEGKTLSGLAEGRVFATSFSVALESRYAPSVNGVETVRQTMTGARIGPCKIVPDADIMQVK